MAKRNAKLARALAGDDADDDMPGPMTLAQGAAVVAEPPLPKVARKLNEFMKPGKRVRIILEENENIPPTGQFIGLQGRGYMLRAGEPADVPIGIINILNDAVESVPIVDPQTQQVQGYRNKLRFPYRIVTT